MKTKSEILKNTKILQKESPILRLIAKEISLSEITSKTTENILKKMKDGLEEEDDAVAIAAPQIGESVRIFMVSGRVIWYIANREEVPKPKQYPPDEVFINPKIIKFSREKEWMEEGCLSVRYLYGKIRRSKKIIIKAYDEHGKLFQRGASGLLAQIFQHECDHLEGKLFIDKAKDIEDIPPEKLDKKK